MQHPDAGALVLGVDVSFVDALVQTIVIEQRFHGVPYDRSHVVQLCRVILRFVLGSSQGLSRVVKGVQPRHVFGNVA